MNTFIDIHTHKSTNSDLVFELINILIHSQTISKNGYYSVGWHPWYIEKYSISEIEDKLLETIQNKNVLAIGEIGLDRSIKTPFDLQKKVFQFQLKLAIKQNFPVIIHCVKAYADLLEILKKEKLTIPFILHDFNGNKQLIDQLLKYNVYFSFGGKLLDNPPKKIDALKHVPINKLFFETDESLESIEMIYLRASKILSISKDELLNQISSNFKTVFGDGLVGQN